MEATVRHDPLDLVYSEGYDAYRRYQRDFNPYRNSSKYERQAWDNGWLDAQLKMNPTKPEDDD